MALGDFSDAIIILFIILVSSVLGFWQEKGAANAVAELLKMVQIKCRIIRDEKEMELPVDNAVPADIIIFIRRRCDYRQTASAGIQRDCL
jgi:Mg2+-importing ATPase